MDETTKSVIERITVQYPTVCKIPSGHESKVYYECARLSPNELARLAAEATGHLPEDAFDVALGIAYNGILFAAAIAGGREVAIQKIDGGLCGGSVAGKKVVIVDDVAHSGRHLRAAEQAALAAGAIVIGYAVIVDRSDGKLNSADKPLWSAFQTNML